MSKPRFVLNEPVLTRAPDRCLVEALGIEFPAFETRELRADQELAVLEVLRAVLRLLGEQLVVGEQRIRS